MVRRINYYLIFSGFMMVSGALVLIGSLIFAIALYGPLGIIGWLAIMVFLVVVAAVSEVEDPITLLISFGAAFWFFAVLFAIYYFLYK